MSKKNLFSKKKICHKIFILAEDDASLPSIGLTLKLQTTKPPGTIQTRKTVDLGIAPISVQTKIEPIYEYTWVDLIRISVYYYCFISLCVSGVLLTNMALLSRDKAKAA